MNEGMTLPVNPRSAGTRNRGFTAGLVPPTAGWLWQPAHPTKLKRGPTPSSTSSSSEKSARPYGEHLGLVGGQAGNRAPCSSRPAPNAGVPGSERRRRLDLCLDHPRQGEERDDEDDEYG